MQQALKHDEILVVVVVEHRRCLQIERGQVVVARARCLWAIRLPRLREGGVDVGVVVYVGAEVGAPCLAYGVSTYGKNKKRKRKIIREKLLRIFLKNKLIDFEHFIVIKSMDNLCTIVYISILQVHSFLCFLLKHVALEFSYVLYV